MTTNGFAMLLLALVLAPLNAAGADQAPPAGEDPWAELRGLVGSWEGAIDGRLGTGAGLRRYDFILGGRFLQSKHASMRAPQEKTPEGDIHEELGIFSFDRGRKKLIYRQFVNEGFVNRYACSAESARLVCVTDEVESGPGWQARWTLTLKSRFELEEVFELAPPGKELVVYFTNHWTRRPALE